MLRAEPRRGLRPWHWVLVGLAVLALKQVYAQVGAAQLQWLLAPLAGVLNLAGGLAFEPQPDGTWLDAGRRVLLVKACAGGNFLLTAWLAWLWRQRHATAPLRAVLTAAAAAWVTTLAANALRILLAVHAQEALGRLGGLSPAETHRLLGIAVYFVSLSLLLARPGRLHTALITAAGLYLGVNLLLPALRAAWLGLPGLDPAHLLWTAGVPLAVLALSVAVRWVRKAVPIDPVQGSDIGPFDGQSSVGSVASGIRTRGGRAPLIAQFVRMGWRHTPGSQEDPGLIGRVSFREVMLPDDLREALHRINLDPGGPALAR